MARPRTQGPKTRERILDVAQALFIEYGYDKTSLRDIAERLGITKAALYYYFERKEDILLELHLRVHQLGGEILDELEAIEDGPARVAAFPETIDRLITGILGNREVMLFHYRNLSALEAVRDNQRNRLENDDLLRRFARILSSPAIPLAQRVRMAGAMGVIVEVMVMRTAFAEVPPDELVELVREATQDLLAGPRNTS